MGKKLSNFSLKDRYNQIKSWRKLRAEGFDKI
jgi:hypothetical protein